MKIKVGLVAEDYLDSLSIKNLLGQRYGEKVQLVPLAKGVNGTKLGTQKLINTVKAETKKDVFKFIVYVMDLDAFESQTKELEAKKRLFKDVDNLLSSNGVHLLNIWELEALIFGDIDTFNKLYNIEYKATGNPMLIKDPKEKLKHLTFKSKKRFEVSHCPDIFKQLNIDKVEKNCSCFKKFITEFNEKLN